MAGIKNMLLLRPKQAFKSLHGFFVGLSEIINFQNIFKTGDFLTIALNEQHFLSLKGSCMEN